MGRPVYMAAAVKVPAPPAQVFALITDWPRHRDWMFLTTARQVGRDAIEAYTGVWPFGFLDTMTITHWEPPALVRVEHTGRVVRGRGAIRVRPCAGGSRVIWAEELRPPFGVLGRVLWPLVRPVGVALARRSLRKLAALVTT
ncbi:SRPBCC family protein [Nonomuraea basaltis]|uniref:SRPBCC family protein n=1 Tax=Nonomuraea basaltis TaxID=2495887 RepID=UPI00110C466D|nr:SRPBCC family protein [Nonomuraea basaltis]TMR90071.1 SRPBCC family protein [Nonomuraea basaltis]